MSWVGYGIDAVFNAAGDITTYTTIRGIDRKSNASFSEAVMVVLAGNLGRMVATFIDNQLSKTGTLPTGMALKAELGPIMGALNLVVLNAIFPKMIKGGSLEVFVQGTTIYLTGHALKIMIDVGGAQLMAAKKE